MKQLIFDSKIRMVESNFKLNSAVSTSNDVSLLKSHFIINEFSSVINAEITLKPTDLNFSILGSNAINPYAIVEIESDNLFYLQFVISNTLYFLKTRSFSYKNNIDRITEISVLNGTLSKIGNMYETLSTSQTVTMNYVLVSEFNYNYLHSENYPYA